MVCIKWFAYHQTYNDICSFDPAVEEGAVYAMCMAGQGDQATLSQWISGLQETCSILGQIPTVFRLESGPRELQTSSDAQQTPEQEVETEQIIEEEPLHSQRVKQWEPCQWMCVLWRRTVVVLHQSNMMNLIFNLVTRYWFMSCLLHTIFELRSVYSVQSCSMMCQYAINWFGSAIKHTFL